MKYERKQCIQNIYQAQDIQSHDLAQQSVINLYNSLNAYEEVQKEQKSEQNNHNELQQVRRIAKNIAVPSHIRLMLLESKLKSLQMLQQNLQCIESTQIHEKHKQQKRSQNAEAVSVQQNLSTASFATQSQSSIFDEYSISNYNCENCESFQTYEHIEKHIQQIQSRILEKRVEKFEIHQELQAIQDDIFETEKVMLTKMQYDQHLTERIKFLREQIQKVQSSKPSLIQSAQKIQKSQQIPKLSEVFKKNQNKDGVLPDFCESIPYRINQPDPGTILLGKTQNNLIKHNYSNNNTSLLSLKATTGVVEQQIDQQSGKNQDTIVGAVVSSMFKFWWVD